jgi:hypothetical protein
MLNHSNVIQFGSPYLIPCLMLPDLPKISKKNFSMVKILTFDY